MLQNVQQVAQGIAAVQNIFHHNHMPARDVLRQVLGDLHLAAGGRSRTVGGYGHKIQRTGQTDGPAQVGHEDKRTPKYADKHHFLARIVGLNLPGNLGHPVFQLFLCK